jgi:hypothetical protein
MRVALLCLLSAALLALPASAQAATFGPDLSTATPDYPWGCPTGGGCTVIDPIDTDMELVLPDPVRNGNQTGVVTQMHVKSAATAPAQFVVVEWSGKPGDGQPFPSGVMAVSAPVTLHPGMNHFNTNLPVDFRLAANGFESWSQVSLNILDGSSPIPAQMGGTFAATGFLVDNGAPLTQTTADLTGPSHWLQHGSLMAPARLLIAGDVTITTGQGGGDTGGDTGGDNGTTETLPVPQLTLGSKARLKGRTATLPLECVGAADCAGTVRIQSRPAAGATASAARKKAETVTYASGAFSIGAGLTGSVRAKLSSAGRKAVRHHRALRAYANATFADGSVTSTKITLRR